MARTPLIGSGPLRRSVIAGLILAVLVLAAGSVLASTQHKTVTAESVLVVLPRADLDEATSAAFYETLSRGQIVGTFAEVASNPTFQQEAASKLGLSPDARAGLSTAVSVVPDTSVILVRVTADDAETATEVTNAVASAVTTYLTTLSDAFRTEVVHSAAGSGESTGLSPFLVLALALVAALTLGVALQQATYHLLKAGSLADQPIQGSRSAPDADDAPERATDSSPAAGRG